MLSSTPAAGRMIWKEKTVNWLSASIVGCLFPAVSVPPISLLRLHTYHSVRAPHKLLHSAINIYCIVNAKQFSFTGSSPRPFHQSPDSVSSSGVPPQVGHLFLQCCIPLILGTDTSHFLNKKIYSQSFSFMIFFQQPLYLYYSIFMPQDTKLYFDHAKDKLIEIKINLKWKCLNLKSEITIVGCELMIDWSHLVLIAQL